MRQIIKNGREAFHQTLMDMGRMMAEAILLMDREEQSGQDYATDPNLYKWASQRGSIDMGDQ